MRAVPAASTLAAVGAQGARGRFPARGGSSQGCPAARRAGSGRAGLRACRRGASRNHRDHPGLQRGAADRAGGRNRPFNTAHFPLPNHLTDRCATGKRFEPWPKIVCGNSTGYTNQGRPPWTNSSPPLASRLPRDRAFLVGGPNNGLRGGLQPGLSAPQESSRRANSGQ